MNSFIKNVSWGRGPVGVRVKQREYLESKKSFQKAMFCLLQYTPSFSRVSGTLMLIGIAFAPSSPKCCSSTLTPQIIVY